MQDIITIRGKGRFEFKEITGNTKKGRYVIKVEKCGIESLTFLPNNTLLTGVTINYNNLLNYCFIQFKFNDDNNELIEISRKNNVHDWTIYDLKYVVINGQYKIASTGSMDCKVKIWS